MIPPPTADAGTLVLDVATPTPSVVLLRVDDESGRTVVRRRVRDLQVALPLPAGRYRVVAVDDRAAHDPARHAGTALEVTVAAGAATPATLALVRGAHLRVTTSPWALVTAVDTAGERVEVRADGFGDAVLGGLHAGTVTVSAHLARLERCSRIVEVEASIDGAAEVHLPVTTPTGRLLIRVGGSDPRPVAAAEVHVTDAAGRTVTAPLVDGSADLRRLRPGPVTIAVPPSVGHRGTTLDVEVEPGVLSAVDVVVPIGASVRGRVVQGRRARRQYAAVVTLLDADGVEVERTRTDGLGRFEIGTGLGSRADLTVVVTTGPETLHVTRAAVADVTVHNGVRHDLGTIALPVGGRRAVWANRTSAIAAMKLPSTRV